MIRDAVLDDLAGLVARGKLHHEELGFPWAYDEESTAFSCVKLIQAGTLLVEDTLKGYIGYELGGIYFNLNVILATEHFWYVLPSDRDTGLGQQLLKAAQDKAKAQGADWFSTQLPQQSKAAAQLVDKQGFSLMHGIYGIAL